MPMSITIGGAVVLLIERVLDWGGVSIGTEAVTNFVHVGGALLGLVMVYLGRVRKGDITWYGKRVTSYP